MHTTHQLCTAAQLVADKPTGRLQHVKYDIATYRFLYPINVELPQL